MSLYDKKEQSFAPLPPKPNGWNKHMGEHDRIPPCPPNSMHHVHCYICRWCLPELNTLARSRRTCSGRSSSSHKSNPRTATFIQVVPQRRRPSQASRSYVETPGRHGQRLATSQPSTSDRWDHREDKEEKPRVFTQSARPPTPLPPQPAAGGNHHRHHHEVFHRQAPARSNHAPGQTHLRRGGEVQS
jgi:hypothetical protein